MKLPALLAIYEKYETFSRLAQDHFSGSLAGRLLLRSGLHADGLADIVAACIAGGCSLCIEPDAAALREALRAGFCDFVVGPLDEALRILKNELRRGRPISVGMTAGPEPTLAEMIHRGLQPDLISLQAGEPRRIFLERGAVLLPDTPAAGNDGAIIEWAATADIPRSMSGIAQVAAHSLDVTRPDTPLRQRWLHTAPRHLGRAFAAALCVRMTPAESSAFVTAAGAQFPAISVTSDRARL